MLGQILYVQLDATVFGGEWKRMVAELFIEYTWKKNEWLDSEMKSVKYFDKIVRMKF
jgi:acyl-CoA dehydrogenase